MKYQLVLQWPASPVSGYDALIGVEESLVKGPLVVADRVGELDAA